VATDETNCDPWCLGVRLDSSGKIVVLHIHHA